VAEPARNALCVESAQELHRPGNRVTLAGQTRQGTRGSHGRNGTTNIIGFSSQEAIEALDLETAGLDARLDELARQRRVVEDELAALSRAHLAYEAVQAARWDDIDVASADARIDQLHRSRQAILDADDRLRALEAHMTHLESRLDKARERRFELQRRRKDLDEEHSALVERQDKVNEAIDRVEDEGRVVLEEEQSARLDQEFASAAAPEDPANLSDFEPNLARLQQRLRTAIEGARTEVQRAEQDLERTFAAYQLKWEDPNLGRSAVSYPEYAAVLDDILATGLHQRRAEWRRRLTEWSGQDLVPLAGALNSSISKIEERLAPINDILQRLPFGACQDRLQIKLHKLASVEGTAFRSQLKKLSSAATKELDEDQMEARFRDLQMFMAQIRRRDDPRARGEAALRDRLLDVRRHVQITAERYSEDGTLLSTHSALGGKSGGESQELVAFIVGAALRFRLGDELRTRPRFAPVFLDEGFVKSDAEFAGRAVAAWKGLGFQLIVGAPLDKVTALEPHMDELLAITKNTATNFSFVHRIKDTGQRAGTPGA
jgi:uncharacterized protein YPO0396